MCGLFNVTTLLLNIIKLKIIIIFSLIISSLTFAENRPDFVCGKFNGHVMEVPSNYIDTFAEYEGASVWNSDFINNKKGCDANFRVLPLVVNWPDMGAGSEEKKLMDGYRFKGLIIGIEPFERPDTDMSYKRKFFLKESDDKRFDPVIYHKELNLYSVKMTRKLYRSELADRSDPYFFDENINNYYWAEIDGRIPVVFDCMWLPWAKRYSYCEALFVMPEIGVLVDIEFTPEKLPQWQAIVSKTQEFILSKIKY